MSPQSPILSALHFCSPETPWLMGVALPRPPTDSEMQDLLDSGETGGTVTGYTCSRCRKEWVKIEHGGEIQPPRASPMTGHSTSHFSPERSV